MGDGGDPDRCHAADQPLLRLLAPVYPEEFRHPSQRGNIPGMGERRRNGATGQREGQPTGSGTGSGVGKRGYLSLSSEGFLANLEYVGFYLLLGVLLGSLVEVVVPLPGFLSLQP